MTDIEPTPALDDVPGDADSLAGDLVDAEHDLTVADFTDDAEGDLT